MPKSVTLGTLDGVNPPLDAVPLYPPESVLPESDSEILRPRGLDDLRGGHAGSLRYPATAALIFAGIPGAGKSTALRRLFDAGPESEHACPGPDGSLVFDSIQARNSWRPRLSWLPYPLWRPVVHLVHFNRIWIALRDHRGPVVIHDCGTVDLTRRMLARWALRQGRELHMVLLDVPAESARAGQFARGRRVGRASFHWHVWRWRRLLGQVEDGSGPRPAPASVVLLDRPAADRLREVRFAA
ncbi:AAA family ATPase [Nocardia sp. NPDC003345]